MNTEPDQDMNKDMNPDKNDQNQMGTGSKQDISDENPQDGRKWDNYQTRTLSSNTEMDHESNTDQGNSSEDI
jgi:hypothetical protein